MRPSGPAFVAPRTSAAAFGFAAAGLGLAAALGRSSIQLHIHNSQPWSTRQNYTTHPIQQKHARIQPRPPSQRYLPSCHIWKSTSAELMDKKLQVLKWATALRQFSWLRSHDQKYQFRRDASLAQMRVQKNLTGWRFDMHLTAPTQVRSIGIANHDAAAITVFWSSARPKLTNYNWYECRIDTPGQRRIILLTLQILSREIWESPGTISHFSWHGRNNFFVLLASERSTKNGTSDSVIPISRRWGLAYITGAPNSIDRVDAFLVPQAISPAHSYTSQQMQILPAVKMVRVQGNVLWLHKWPKRSRSIAPATQSRLKGSHQDEKHVVQDTLRHFRQYPTTRSDCIPQKNRDSKGRCRKTPPLNEIRRLTRKKHCVQFQPSRIEPRKKPLSPGHVPQRIHSMTNPLSLPPKRAIPDNARSTKYCACNVKCNPATPPTPKHTFCSSPIGTYYPPSCGRDRLRTAPYKRRRTQHHRRQTQLNPQTRTHEQEPFATHSGRSPDCMIACGTKNTRQMNVSQAFSDASKFVPKGSRSTKHAHLSFEVTSSWRCTCIRTECPQLWCEEHQHVQIATDCYLCHTLCLFARPRNHTNSSKCRRQQSS